MAGINQLTTGYNSKVFYVEGLDKSVTQCTKEITNIQNIADIADTAATVTVNQYAGDGHTVTLAGIKSVAPFDLVMNYKAIEHEPLKALFDNGEQISLVVKLIAGSAETYVAMNANILSWSLSTPADGVRTLTCSVGVLGGLKVTHKA
ncbi:hypothetical protein C942_00502 [Photobacterium marinum]|uniref:Uncharacterized protein n=1 Tax=Photobacterium marinum TaxID=1056511 RepID=L8JB24_9GAMM|nr:hypothetical protein [Photobacterium marinum]ELR66060.1 hypothetical protein C942_00502 [Photobacterium marinum]